MGFAIRVTFPIGLLCCAVLVLSTGGGGAGGAQLLVNGGFESGVDPWQASNGTLAGVPSPVHAGAGAARLTGDGTQVQHEAFQWVVVAPGAPYELTAWVLHNHPNVSSVFLRIVWADENLAPVSTTDSLAPLTFTSPTFQPLTTGPVVAPLAAQYARIGIRVSPGSGPLFDFTIYIDDVSLLGPDATPTAPPTSGAPTSNPTPVTSVPPTAPATVTPTPSATNTPTATPRRSPTPVPEDTVFGSLTNGGFETLRGDGSPFAWRRFGGEMSVSNSTRFDGSYALRLTSQTTSTKWSYQNVSVLGGTYYEASVMALRSSPDLDQVFLRVSWYDTDDASGESIESVDSLTRLETDSKAFRLITTGPVSAPPEARVARIRLMVRPRSAAFAEAFFDNVTFSQVPAPTESPTPSVTKLPTSTPTPGATVTPATATATPLPATDTPTPTPSEPSVFPALVNGSFEDVREDGTPYGWHKFGGEFAASDIVRSDGELSLEISSNTNSTKWVGQVVAVAGGTYYVGAALVQAFDPSVEAAFLRISWYSSLDGAGDALDSSDSNLVGNDPDFLALATGAIQAPAGASSARVKLMVRPVGDVAARAYFDAVTFHQVPAPSPGSPPATEPPSTPVPVVAPVPAGAEPSSFDALVNGNFEDVRPDGSPYAWRNIGGRMTAGPPAASGQYALILSSSTASMKWAYQTVSVTAGRYYDSAVDIMAVSGKADAFIRVSWYQSTDGSGEMVDQADSHEQPAGATFRRVSTGAILAPPGVNSARVRLVLRPASDVPAVVAFDLASFGPSTAPAVAIGIAGRDASSEPLNHTPSPTALGAAASPVPLVNDHAVDDRELLSVGQQGSGGSDYDWIIALAVGIPIGGLVTAGLINLRNRREP